MRRVLFFTALASGACYGEAPTLELLHPPVGLDASSRSDVPLPTPDSGRDAGVRRDAGMPRDSGPRRDAGQRDTGVHPDARVPDSGGGFIVARHPALPQIPNQGGTMLMHPRVVTITFADDPNRMPIEAYATWLVGSSWLMQVGAEYGVGAGSILGTVERNERAPDAITDTEIQLLIARGIRAQTIPRPNGGGFADVLYMIYYPAHTTITVDDQMTGQTAQSCVDFGAYHTEAMQGSLHFAYAVIPACPTPLPGLNDWEVEQAAASHEFIEAATDAFPSSDPAFQLPSNNPSAWTLVGGENADLCANSPSVYRESGFVAQRIYSNRAASTGVDDPCIPVDPSAPFYLTQPAPEIRTIAAGASTMFNLTGWSVAAVPDWTIFTETSGAFSPTVSLSATTLNNGGRATMTVTVPNSAPSGSFAIVYLYSAISMNDFHLWPAAIRVR